MDQIKCTLGEMWQYSFAPGSVTKERAEELCLRDMTEGLGYRPILYVAKHVECYDPVDHKAILSVSIQNLIPSV